jgi:hypothetical protein
LEETRKNGDGLPVLWTIQRGEMMAHVQCVEEGRYFSAVFPYSILEDIKRILEPEDISTVLESHSVDTVGMDEDEQLEMAAEIILDGVPDDVMFDFYNNLVEMLSHPRLSFQFYTTDQGTISGFQLEKSIYPTSDSFEYREYDEAVQTVVTIGHAAMKYCQRCIDVEEAVSHHSTPEPLRYIQ